MNSYFVCKGQIKLFLSLFTIRNSSSSWNNVILVALWRQHGCWRNVTSTDGPSIAERLNYAAWTDQSNIVRERNTFGDAKEKNPPCPLGGTVRSLFKKSYSKSISSCFNKTSKSLKSDLGAESPFPENCGETRGFWNAKCLIPS